MDDTEESRKAIQEYQNQLKDAETSLKETEWSRFISESEKLLDDLYSDYSETLNARLDNIDALFTDVISDANANANNITNTINSVAKDVGYSIALLNQTAQQIKNTIQQKTTNDAISDINIITSPYNDNVTYGANTNPYEQLGSASYSGRLIAVEHSLDSIKSIMDSLDELDFIDVSKIQAKGYAKGSKNISHKQLAWTQENGTEFIYRASDGALLTPLDPGMVFTHEMSKNLWEMAQGNLPDITSGFKAPTMVAKANATSVNNQNAISINLPNVTNYNEFKTALQKDTKFVGFMQEVTLGQALGKNKLNKNKY